MYRRTRIKDCIWFGKVLPILSYVRLEKLFSKSSVKFGFEVPARMQVEMCDWLRHGGPAEVNKKMLSENWVSAEFVWISPPCSFLRLRNRYRIYAIRNVRVSTCHNIKHQISDHVASDQELFIFQGLRAFLDRVLLANNHHVHFNTDVYGILRLCGQKTQETASFRCRWHAYPCTSRRWKSQDFIALLTGLSRPWIPASYSWDDQYLAGATQALCNWVRWRIQSLQDTGATRGDW